MVSNTYLAIGLSLGSILLILVIYLIYYVHKINVSSEGYNDITTGPINSDDNNNNNNIPAYVICLNDQLFLNARKNINLPNLQKFDANKGSTLDPNKLDLTIKAKRSILLDTIRETHADLGTINAVGCALSHMDLWSKVVNENLKYMYIFESDAVCTDNFNEYVDLFLQKENPHVLFFGIIGRPVGHSEKISKIPGRFYGLHGYMITYEGAKLLLQNSMPIEQQVDSYISDLNLLSNDPQNKLNMEPLNLYVVNDNRCIQKNSDGTSIQIKGVRGN